MIRYPSTDIITFLAEVDRQLSEKESMIIIGGAAASLAYRARSTTSDIDTASTINKALSRALSRARKRTGFDIPVSAAGVYDAPYGYEDRLRSFDCAGFTKLSVYVPERHDLVLMKTLRGEEHDIRVIEEIHQEYPLDLGELQKRFLKEMTHITGQLEEKRLNLILLIEQLYGKAAALETEAMTDAWATNAQSPKIG